MEVDALNRLRTLTQQVIDASRSMTFCHLFSAFIHLHLSLFSAAFIFIQQSIVFCCSEPQSLQRTNKMSYTRVNNELSRVFFLFYPAKKLK